MFASYFLYTCDVQANIFAAALKDHVGRSFIQVQTELLVIPSTP